MVSFLHHPGVGVQEAVAEVLVQFSDAVAGPDGGMYVARACGSEMPDGLWQGWIEFLPAEAGRPIRTGRETTQPNRRDALYWATGLTGVYLEGALRRALNPPVRPPEPDIPPPMFETPAGEYVPHPHTVESILNPFSAFRKGEALLRSQLAALSDWHLVNIIRDYGLTDLSPADLGSMDSPALIEVIVSAVRAAESLKAR